MHSTAQSNNQPERDLWPTKKISGRLASDDVTEARLTIRGYVCTAVKHGVIVLHAMRSAITGQPWFPHEAASLAYA